jgi:translation initiation factor 3 subunit K
MGLSFDYSPDRPENIEAILNGLDRYNPETTSTFQEYVAQQCENQTYDCYGNLALLKLYVTTVFFATPKKKRRREPRIL